MSTLSLQAEPKPTRTERPIRVLYSFPHKIGGPRICTTAWYQVDGLAAAGADVTVLTGAICRSFPRQVKLRTTLALNSWRKLRIPYRLLGGTRACELHDWLVARQLRNFAGKIDVVHVWSLAAMRTIKEAKRLGMLTFLERPNAHTRFAYDVVQKECDRIGVALPRNHEHAYNAEVLRIEEAEYRLADRLLCPSEFVVKTFLDHGFPRKQLVRHIYGFDEKTYFPDLTPRDRGRGLTVLFVGVCAVRKGLHYALEAWLQSPAHRHGTFLIAGEFLPVYAEKLSSFLSHPSVKVLGHRNDVPELMRKSDLMILPSIEEGFGLVCTEAMGSGCVPLVSEACTDICTHLENALVHPIGDVKVITEQITRLDKDRALLERLRAAGLRRAPQITWNAAGCQLLEVYRETMKSA
jgi:glycosyltransferase involved in cell wall biosynthesis